jgi:hypothetical protein
MRNFIRALALLPALAITACGGGGDGEGDTKALATFPGGSINPGEQFLLGYGETAYLGPLSLEFTDVEDSRCGASSSAVCVWEGNAFILVSATNGTASQILTLNSNSKFPISAVFAGHVIELRRLDPQPRFTTQPALEEYSATLVIDP